MEKQPQEQPQENYIHRGEVESAMELYEKLIVNDPEGASMLIDSFRREALAEYEKIRASFVALHTRLNLFNVRELDLFDLPIESVDEDEKYIRFWRDNEGDFKAQELIRRDGSIVDRGTPVDTSGKFRYVFEYEGRDMVAHMDILDKAISGGTGVVDDDGNVRGERTLFESGVIIATFENEVLPGLKSTRDMLSRLWQAIHDVESGGRSQY